MPLVEVVRGRQSSPEAVATIHALAVRLGKVPIVVRDGPGFLVNRVLTFYVNEAVRLLGEGVSVESIDGSMRAFGMPMGPFEMLDQVGLDTSLHVAGVLKAALGLRASAEGTVLERLVEAGSLGKKSGRGFYRWGEMGDKKPDPAVAKHAGSPAPRDLPAETLQERMVLSLINEAAVCLEEGVVREARDLDLAMVLGTGFPPFRGGLLRHADEVGIPIVVDRLTRLADAHGERFRPAGLLREMVRDQRRFYSG
jgi:3-hydroxyacyl-CoA dehydrogenase/enoyl-CoA hydratase/3-hydroxybutyryl-CoA epimerase